MKNVHAQFRPRRRLGRPAQSMLLALVVCTVAAVGAAVWQQQRAATLREQVATLAEQRRSGTVPPPPRPVPTYATSAKLMLRERAAPWASMLRTLESASLIGVTPTVVEFDSADGSARAELNYADSTALVDYLDRANEGVAPGGAGRWTLAQARMEPGGTGAVGTGGVVPASTSSVATIQSAWGGVRAGPEVAVNAPAP